MFEWTRASIDFPSLLTRLPLLVLTIIIFLFLTEIRHALQLEHNISKSISWLELFKSPGNRKRMRIILAIGLFSQWSGNGLVCSPLFIYLRHTYHSNSFLGGVVLYQLGP
jgi:hypothetical protein